MTTKALVELSQVISVGSKDELTRVLPVFYNYSIAILLRELGLWGPQQSEAPIDIDTDYVKQTIKPLKDTLVTNVVEVVVSRTV